MATRFGSLSSGCKKGFSGAVWSCRSKPGRRLRTDGSGSITNTPDNCDPPDGSSGVRTSLFDVEVVDDNDNVLPAGEVGEIVCRPNYPNIMFAGYWGRPQATVDANQNLWFHTGDLGRFDKEGFFFFIDRKKDYLRRRGENISSMEVENTFHQHEAVAEFACYGVPSEVGEDDVQVSIVLRENVSIRESDLCIGL
ncbi:MAG: AMP-binding protein [Hahellaceae bacterium]|nr:AMP-binding protein [Hahellaceae bacterium]